MFRKKVRAFTFDTVIFFCVSGCFFEAKLEFFAGYGNKRKQSEANARIRKHSQENARKRKCQTISMFL
jgi:hypothetical protein